MAHLAWILAAGKELAQQVCGPAGSQHAFAVALQGLHAWSSRQLQTRLNIKAFRESSEMREAGVRYQMFPVIADSRCRWPSWSLVPHLDPRRDLLSDRSAWQSGCMPRYRMSLDKASQSDWRFRPDQLMATSVSDIPLQLIFTYFEVVTQAAVTQEVDCESRWRIVWPKPLDDIHVYSAFNRICASETPIDRQPIPIFSDGHIKFDADWVWIVTEAYVFEYVLCCLKGYFIEKWLICSRILEWTENTEDLRNTWVKHTGTWHKPFDSLPNPVRLPQNHVMPVLRRTSSTAALSAWSGTNNASRSARANGRRSPWVMGILNWFMRCQMSPNTRVRISLSSYSNCGANWANSVDSLTKILSVSERDSASNAAAGSGADSLIDCSASITMRTNPDHLKGRC